VAARVVDQRAPEALAGLRGNPGIAQPARLHEGVQRAVALVDDDRARGGERRHAGVQRAGTLHRLLDEQDGGAQPRQPRLGLHRAPQGQGAIGVLVLLVAIQRRVVGGAGVEHGRDAAQPLHVGAEVAAHLQLPEAVAVGGEHLLQRFRQTVIHALRLVGGDDRVEQADRVAGVDSRGLRRRG
jgi:hypothetical protein